eukprot:CAMPEP_0202729108 /NCGR_PEP_ID=MMETSP1385-20130828/185964_1 /ASSEMBLY_ACC=CAM_ASM_000861 /TAXON_ID=933848 /ORGANISM="Elphidium margaritaceum" /LENGTH=356 /DNA_ID=CAMNT_0049395365 /DNA_START=16 /DNA_END=1084 /DNA_ORIENTATION=+
MTHFAEDTEGMDLETWLKSNDLEALWPKLKAAKFSLHALLHCSEQDIRDLCAEFKWSTVQRIKLSSALKATSGADLNLNRQKIVFLGIEEKRILDEMSRQHEVSSANMQQVQQAIDGWREARCNALCAEFKWSTVQRIKLSSALNATSGAALNLNQQKIVFLGIEEKRIFDEMSRQHEVSSANMQQVQQAIDGLERSALQCTKEIHARHAELVSVLEKKKLDLLRSVQSLKAQRRKELDGVLQTLTARHRIALDAQSECKQAAVNADISSASRLQQMTAALNKQKESEQKLQWNAEQMKDCAFQLAVHFDRNAFNANFKSVLDVGFDHERMALKEFESTQEIIQILSFSADYKSSD